MIGSYNYDSFIINLIGDEQMAAWLMAVYFQGMNNEETALLTHLMEHSGDTLNLSAIRGIVVPAGHKFFYLPVPDWPFVLQWPALFDSPVR